MSDSVRADLLEFWFGGEPDLFREAWFRPDTAFDATLRDRFGAAAAEAAAGGHAGLVETAEGAVALLLLLDQLPRNLHRGSPQAFAADPLAREAAREAVLVRRHDRALPVMQRIFLYLPFEHSEAMADQDVSVALFEGLRDDPRAAAPGGVIDYAWRHRDVVLRFGRFPHRNAVLGRESSPSELEFLASGGGF
ncbi:DUF924 family protein [Pararoseomonas sp. SCSIO 73927]|uniref:DUF924 family protein n=1 Tax=Pararoseomonas sp. SCSIO 73927 TaxID=3114537 RepID=UPI0030D3946B